MTAKSAPIKRHRMSPTILDRSKSIIGFQKTHKATVKFHTCKMSKHSTHNIIKCVMTNSVGVNTHAYGSSYSEAFRNMKKMYTQKLQS